MRFLTTVLLFSFYSFSAYALEKSQIDKLVSECAPCHGADGIGQDVEVPNLAGQHGLYLLNQLQNFKSGKRPHKEMKYMSRHLSDEEMKALADYYSQLTRN